MEKAPRKQGFFSLDEDGAVAHAARGGDGGDEGRQGSHDDFHRDFKDSFLFLVHGFKVFRLLILVFCSSRWACS